MRTFLSAALGVIFCSVLASNSQAQVVFDNGLNNLNDAYLASQPQAAGSPTQHVADDFSFAAQQRITEVNWRGIYWPTDNSPTSDAFVFRIYDDNNGLPTGVGSQIYEYTAAVVDKSDTGLILAGSRLFEYSADITPFIAEAGEEYWLEIFNNVNNVGWFWGANTTIGSLAWTQSTEWSGTGGATAFQLENGTSAVPEPSTFLLLGAGLGGLAFIRRRK